MWGNSNMTRCFKRHWVNSGDNGLDVYSIGLKNCEKKITILDFNDSSFY